jgi:chaperonin cofactor prefoldin
MTLLQQELRQALAAVTTARERLSRIEQARAEAEVRLGQANEAVEAARVVLREAAGARAVGDGGDAAVTTARKRLSAALADAEIAVAELEGVEERADSAEQEVERHDRHVARVAARIAEDRARALEEVALAHARKLGDVLIERRKLARLARDEGTRAMGTLTDPLGCDDPANDFTRAIDEAINRSAPGICTVADLLEPAEIAAE